MSSNGALHVVSRCFKIQSSCLPLGLRPRFVLLQSSDHQKQVPQAFSLRACPNPKSRESALPTQTYLDLRPSTIPDPIQTERAGEQIDNSLRESSRQERKETHTHKERQDDTHA